MAASLVAAALVGCNGVQVRSPFGPTPPRAGEVEIPEPINYLLPKGISVHSFTRTRTFDEKGNLRGIEVTIKALDAFETETRAFGDFTFELYTYRENHPDPKGPRIAVWEVPLMDADTNFRHWDRTARVYRFRLQWNRPIPVGQRLILEVVLNSPFTERLFAPPYELIAGQ